VAEASAASIDGSEPENNTCIAAGVLELNPSFSTRFPSTSIIQESADSAAPGMLESISGALDAQEAARPIAQNYNDERSRKVSKIFHYDRVIIGRCGHDTMLGRPSTHSDGCEVIRLTIDDDLRTIKGLQKALRIVQECPRDGLYYGVLCPAQEGACGRH
jgi:hypothetical protein